MPLLVSGAQATFSVESTPPPAPGLLAPENGARGGLFGGFRPISKWGPVEDPSGVTYDLQIATDFTFSAPVLEITGLVSARYELKEQEALSRGQASHAANSYSQVPSPVNR